MGFFIGFSFCGYFLCFTEKIQSDLCATELYDRCLSHRDEVRGCFLVLLLVVTSIHFGFTVSGYQGFKNQCLCKVRMNLLLLIKLSGIKFCLKG